MVAGRLGTFLPGVLAKGNGGGVYQSPMSMESFQAPTAAPLHRPLMLYPALSLLSLTYSLLPLRSKAALLPFPNENGIG